MNRRRILEILMEKGLDVIQILNHFNIEADYSNYGKNILCPIHEDHNPSFQINHNNTVHCYGECDAHLDMVELYAALKEGNVDAGKLLWQEGQIKETINDIINDFGLELNIDEETEEIVDVREVFFKQLKELGLSSINDSLFKKNPPMFDIYFSQLQLEATDFYVYRDPETKEPLMVKVRYEKWVGMEYEEVLFKKKGSEYDICMTATPEKPIKRKSFRCYEVIDGKIGLGKLPDYKKDILYMGDKVLEIALDEHRKYKTWIWFCEGEKEISTLAEYGFTACSLMTGSGSQWQKKYNDIFRGCKVIIAADYDEAGLNYEETLYDALFHGKYKENENGEEKEKYCTIGLKKMNRKFFELHNMPVKSDLTDLIEKFKGNGMSKAEIKSELNNILERSVDYKAFDSVVERNDGFYCRTNRISDFIVDDAVNIISLDKQQPDMIELTIRGTGMATKKTHNRLATIHELFGSADAFNKAFSVMDSTFLGSKAELFELKRFILNHKMFNQRFMYTTNGMYLHDGEWITVTPDGSLRKNGTWDPDIFSSNRICYNSLADIEVPEDQEVKDVGRALLNFNAPEIVSNILGEVGSKILNARYTHLKIKNHSFLANGSKGAGKTETTVKIMATLTNNSTHGEFSLSGQTNFSFLKNVSACNVGGVILQELKLGKMSDYDKKKWSEIFRNNYDRAKNQRGTKDQELNNYDNLNPIILTGEEGLGEESALYERFNLVFMTSEGRKADVSYEENFKVICDSQDVLRGIGKQLIIDIMNLTDDEIKISRESIEENIRSKGLHKQGFVDRVLNNAINVVQGFEVFSKTLSNLGYEGNIDQEAAFKHIIDNFLENVLRINDGKAGDDYQKMLLAYQHALDCEYHDRVVGNPNSAYHVHDRGLWISPSKLRSVIGHFVEDTKAGISILSESEFRKNLVKAGYIKEDSAWKKKFNQKEAKGHYYKVDISEMRKLGLDFLEQLLEEGKVFDPMSFLKPLKASEKDADGVQTELIF